MTELEGHLFVAHGKIESVIHDAALIPVGQERFGAGSGGDQTWGGWSQWPR